MTVKSDELVLGIDGGATKTVAWLALHSTTGDPSVVGRSAAGPANPESVGFDQAIENLDRAIAAVFADAQVAPGPAAAAVLGLAGSDRQPTRQRLTRWAEDCRVAHRFRLVHDAVPVLAAGSPDGWGIALISGTGSLAFGQTRDGRSARAGGWGFLFGDEGSGYAIALAGLRAAAQAADGRAPRTLLLDGLLERLNLREPGELIPAVHQVAADRATIASLAEVVMRTAGEGDQAAGKILNRAAEDLAAMVDAVAGKLDLAPGTCPLALAGGALLGSPELQSRLVLQLDTLALEFSAVITVADPVAGAVRCALRL